MNAYIEIFGFEYTDSVVYDQEKLAEDIAKKNTFWFIGECLEGDEPDFCGGGAIDIDDPVTSHMSKVVIRPKYQRRGLASEMGIKGIFKIFQLTLLPSLTKPKATPATGSVIGTPASMSASVPAQTEAMLEDPLDSNISETTLTV